MYYWDLRANIQSAVHLSSFSSCQKNVLLGQTHCYGIENLPKVSVVVRRMYYWDIPKKLILKRRALFQQLLEECTIGTRSAFCVLKTALTFQQLLEECTIGTEVVMKTLRKQDSFSSCQKNVLLGPAASSGITRATLFQQLLEECTIGTTDVNDDWGTIYRFSSCQKNVLLGLNDHTK